MTLKTKLALSRQLTPVTSPPPMNCTRKPIVQKTFPPDCYDGKSVSSPHEEEVSLNAAAGTIEFAVHMPTSASAPYTVGAAGDFFGYVDICRFVDPMTRIPFDVATLVAHWNKDSGGVYLLHYSYVPYTAGKGAASSRVNRSVIFTVDGASPSITGADKKIIKCDKSESCLVAAAEEFEFAGHDVAMSPTMYETPQFAEVIHMYIAYVREIVKTLTLKEAVTVNSVQEIKKVIETEYQQLPVKRGLMVLFLTHGNTDAAWLKMKDESIEGFQGENELVKELVKSVKPEMVYDWKFFSCCTGKYTAANKTPNVLQAIGEGLSPNRKPSVSICSFEHQVHTWERRGKKRVGYSWGDRKPCVYR